MENIVYSEQLGKVSKARLQWALENELVFRTGDDYSFTPTAMQKYDNFFRWLNGSSSRLYKNPKYKSPSSIKVNPSVNTHPVSAQEVSSLFDGM